MKYDEYKIQVWNNENTIFLLCCMTNKDNNESDAHYPVKTFTKMSLINCFLTGIGQALNHRTMEWQSERGCFPVHIVSTHTAQYNINNK